MSVLFIGNSLDNTGWSDASVNLSLALAKTISPEKLVYRPLKLNQAVPSPEDFCGSPEDYHDFIKLTHEPSCGPYDAVIQHVLPDYAVYDRSVLKPHGKSILYYVSECKGFAGTDWLAKIRVHDKIWVPNKQMFDDLIAHNIKGVRIVPHCFDMEEIKKPRAALNQESGMPFRKDDFIFYTICELSRRKNIAGILKAFFAEFHSEPNIRLLIKAHGGKPQETQKHLEELTKTAQVNMRILPNPCYPRVHFITDRLSREQLHSLHATGHCFVTASYGEAWSIEAFKAMILGKEVVTPHSSGFTEWNLPSRGFRVLEEPCFGADAPFGIQNSNQTWWRPDLQSLQTQMRRAVEFVSSSTMVAKMQRVKHRQWAEKAFSRETVGQTMKRLIYGS